MSTPEPRPSRRAAKAAETTDRLISVARVAFARDGFAATSLDALAAEAGVTRGALHHHFGNKAGLFEAVLRCVDAELDSVMTTTAAPLTDPWAAFRACFHAYLDAALAPDRRRILFQDAPAVLGMKSVDILMESGFAEMRADLHAMIAAGQIIATDGEALAHLLNGATINLAFWVAEGAVEEARLARAHATLAALFDGLTA